MTAVRYAAHYAPRIPARTRSSWYTTAEEKPYLHRHEEASVYKSLALLLVVALLIG